MKTDNFIESQYRLLEISEDNEYDQLYESFRNSKLVKIFGALHKKLVDAFVSMNTRLPTNSNSNNHYWAHESRELSSSIEMSEFLEKNLRDTQYSFYIDDYYREIFGFCKGFLSKSGGSTIPQGAEKINIYYTMPIYIGKNTITLDNENSPNTIELKLVGEGSYAHVYKYYDKNYERNFAIKRAKKTLDSKELERFKREFDEMKKLRSPYVLEVFRYNEELNQYTMEYIEKSLDKFIRTNNTSLTKSQRKNIGTQILKGFSYIHSKGILHRDINPNNILIKEYDDILVVKISDFGLVKIPNSNLTNVSSELKGYFNDPNLALQGFGSYNMSHEVYALTRLIYFVLTGKTNTENISDINIKNFLEKGINPDDAKRFKNAEELAKHFKEL